MRASEARQLSISAKANIVQHTHLKVLSKIDVIYENIIERITKEASKGFKSLEVSVYEVITDVFHNSDGIYLYSRSRHMGLTVNLIKAHFIDLDYTIAGTLNVHHIVLRWDLTSIPKPNANKSGE